MSITAGLVLRQLAAREAADRMGELVALDDRHRNEVRRELRAVRPGAKIDLAKLIASVRARLDERAATAGLTPAERAALHEHVAAANASWRSACAARGIRPGDPAAYGLALAGQASAHVAAEPDVEPDDLDDEPEQPRRPIPRFRLSRGRNRRRDGRRSPAAARPPNPAPERVKPTHERPTGDVAASTRGGAARPPDPGPGRPKRTSGHPRGAGAAYFGPQLLGPGDFDRPLGMSVDYSRSYQPVRPPWLISDGDGAGDDDPDPEEDADHGTASKTTRAA